MKKRRLKPLMITLVVASIVGGIAYGLLIKRSAFMQEMSVAELDALMADKETGKANVAEIIMGSEGWTIKLKNPPCEKVIREFPDGIGYDLNAKANVCGIPIHGQQGPQDVERLFRGLLHLDGQEE